MQYFVCVVIFSRLEKVKKNGVINALMKVTEFGTREEDLKKHGGKL